MIQRKEVQILVFKELDVLSCSPWRAEGFSWSLGFTKGCDPVSVLSGYMRFTD
jgi:hypothetical protein